MYKIITVNGKDYKLEYTIEASLYKDGAEAATNFMLTTMSSDDIKGMVSSMSNIPQTAMTLLYAGLLEYHADEFKSVADVKPLIKQYFAEATENEERNFYTLLELIMTQMGEDNFFSQIGITQMLQAAAETVVENKVMSKKTTKKK